MDCIEEIINIPIILDCLSKVIENGDVSNLLNEIILQSKVEFNYNDDE